VSDFRVAIVGTGFWGLGMAACVKREGIDDLVVLRSNTTIWSRFTWQFRRDARRLEPNAYRLLGRARLAREDAGDEGAELVGRQLAA
jgi:2-polyprenyl-6-methoxyphenol hydroxylase-like FAD-dependent oxidoreductase